MAAAVGDCALANGAILGNLSNLPCAGKIGRDSQKMEADRFAKNVLPVIRTIQSAGPVGMVSIAAQLNQRGIRTQRRGSWHVSSVANVLSRANRCDELR